MAQLNFSYRKEFPLEKAKKLLSTETIAVIVYGVQRTRSGNEYALLTVERNRGST
jgi:hypothetical protein